MGFRSFALGVWTHSEQFHFSACHLSAPGLCLKRQRSILVEPAGIRGAGTLEITNSLVSRGPRYQYLLELFSPRNHTVVASHQKGALFAIGAQTFARPRLWPFFYVGCLKVLSEQSPRGEESGCRTPAPNPYSLACDRIRPALCTSIRAAERAHWEYRSQARYFSRSSRALTTVPRAAGYRTLVPPLLDPQHGVAELGSRSSAVLFSGP